MRSIIDFVRRALAAIAGFIFVFVRLAGETVGHWIRVLQPAAPAAVDEPVRSVDEMLPSPRKSSAAPGDEPVYQAVASIAAALAAGTAPDVRLAAALTPDLRDWMSLLSARELQAVGQFSPPTLKAHLTGRLRIPALLRMSAAEMLERREQLAAPPRPAADFDYEIPLAASAF